MMVRTNQNVTAARPSRPGISGGGGLERAVREHVPAPPAAPTTTIVQTCKKRRLNDAKFTNLNDLGEPPVGTTYRVSGSSDFLCPEFFFKGAVSDVLVFMLDEKWRLHKNCIIKSPYFADLIAQPRPDPAMRFNVSIVDANITKTAVFTVISSLYNSEVKFNSNELVSVLAAAKLFLLDGLVNQCEEIIIKNVSFATATRYLAVAETYYIPALEAFVKRWLLANLLTRGSDKLIFLKGISAELMASLLSDPKLIPFKYEMDMYKMLKNWLFAKLHNDPRNANPDKFFEVQQWKTQFLKSKEGAKYLLPFQALKVRHMLLDLTHSAADVLRKDKIIPVDWIHLAFDHNWKVLSLISNNECQRTLLCDADFERECYRCCFLFDRGNQNDYLFGREFLYGVNLSFLLSANESALVVSRDSGEKERYIAASQPSYNFSMKTSLKWMDVNGSVIKEMHSDLKFLSLKMGEERKIMSVDGNMSYPVFLVVKLLVHSPLQLESN